MMIRNLKAVKLNFPKEIDNPPQSWVIVKEIGNKSENKIIVYYVK